jgi:hypothetical protein
MSFSQTVKPSRAGSLNTASHQVLSSTKKMIAASANVHAHIISNSNIVKWPKYRLPSVEA